MLVPILWGAGDSKCFNNERFEKALRQITVRTVSIAALCAASATAVHAARPFFTDDARVVERGHCQVESFTKSQRAYAGSEVWVMPACNPFGMELTLGRNRIEDEYNTVAQAKLLLKRLEDNGVGYALAAGVFGGDPYANAIASYSFHKRAVLHFNVGAIHNRVPDTDRQTWGLGVEVPLTGRWTAAAETFGQYGDTPTQHAGLRYALVPNRVQIDTTVGHQSADPVRRFTSIGLRLLF